MSLSSNSLLLMMKCMVWGCNLCTIVPTVHVAVVVVEEDSVDSLLLRYFDPPSHSVAAAAVAVVVQHHNKHHVHNIYPTSTVHVHYVSTSMKQSIVSMVPHLPQC